MLFVWGMCEHFLILQMIDGRRTIRHRPHPNLPPQPGEGVYDPRLHRRCPSRCVPRYGE
jgi:hypothetical protein